MNKYTFQQALSIILISSLIVSLPCTSNAQDDVQESLTPETVVSPDEKLSLQLDELSLVLKKQTEEISSLKLKSSKAGSDPELVSEIALANQRLETLYKSFEQLAVGNINLDTIATNEPELTWQEELTIVVKPLLENLRGLTEGPRKREDLRQQISIQKSTALKAEKALSSIEKWINKEPSKNQSRQLILVKSKWVRIKENAEREQQLALYQLESLSGLDSHWLSSLKKATISFFQERGLTLVLAVLVSTAIWLILAGLRKLIDLTGNPRVKHTKRTTYRIIAYTHRLLAIILIIIGILTVFFIRGDILLLIVTLALLFAGALGLKNLLPRFIAESRLLLNVGEVREYEQIVINGIPWRVATINLYCKFTNPEIQGTLRLPISHLKDLVSRPTEEDKWFPSSIGDWVLDNENRLYEVIKQTPVIVELQSSQGTNKLLPTADYFAAGFVNLTKSKQIRITSRFGVGYDLQNIALTEVPKVFQAVVTQHLLNASLETDDINVRVDFANAGESSLDYLIIANISSTASKYYYYIERVIQQACLDACNKQSWNIPFPQLTVHHTPDK